MTEPNEGLGRALFSLWRRLIAIAVIAILIASIPLFPAMIAGWRYYQTGPEIAFGIAVRAVFIALAAVTVAALCTLAAAPLLVNNASRNRRAGNVTRFFVALAAFGDLLLAAKIVVTPLARSAGLIWFPVTMVYTLAFAAAMLLPRSRKQIVTSLDGLLTPKATRRTALTVAAASATVVATEFVLGKAAGTSATPVRRTSRPSSPNILLVTFDALSADDMSLYGYRLPTTPRIDEFARNASVFNNFYSSSTFTTPSVATLLTGLHPSEHGVYHLQGRLGAEHAGQTLPRLMRNAGYTTGVSTSSPHVFCFLEGLAADYDFFPDMPYRTSGLDLWGASRILHQRQPLGSRDRELTDVEALRDYPGDRFSRYSRRLFGRTDAGYSPSANFAQARDVLNRMPDGHFLWVHLYAPHWPYLPDSPSLGRFLPPGRMMTAQDQDLFSGWPNYKPELQPKIDLARLRYDEFIAEADAAFGSFLGGLEESGKLRNTAVIFAADHGESFEGGLFGHASNAQYRSEIHIPLAVRMPGQKEGRRVDRAFDQASFAPTLLEIAGVSRPRGMRAPPLTPWLLPGVNTPPATDGGLAFTQFLANNSIFHPIHAGTAGVIDGSHQYVVDLGSGKGILRGLSETSRNDVDRSAENPELTQQLRKAIFSRFPNLPA